MYSPKTLLSETLGPPSNLPTDLMNPQMGDYELHNILPITSPIANFNGIIATALGQVAGLTGIIQ